MSPAWHRKSDSDDFSKVKQGSELMDSSLDGWSGDPVLDKSSRRQKSAEFRVEEE